MKPNMIVMSHGMLAAEVVASAQMIVGELEGIYAIGLLPSDSLADITARLESCPPMIDSESPVIIMADLGGGTPSNVALQAMLTRANTRLLTGFNLSMVVAYAVSEERNLDELAGELRTTGVDAIQIIEKPTVAIEEDGYED